MSIAVYVIDTSYLVELFGCMRENDIKIPNVVKERFKVTNRAGGRFFVPLPCLFELGDHIADVRHDKKREKIASQLLATVESCLAKNQPWTITPTGPPEDILSELLKHFAPLASRERIGLVDTFTMCEALRLKGDLKSYKAKVHIWTNEQALKRKEPDSEPNPLFW